MKNTFFGLNKADNEYIITADVYEEIRMTLGTRKPEQGGILGSSDGVHIDHYYFDKNSSRTSASYTMNVDDLNKVIHEWNDNGVRLVGLIHSHPTGCTKPSSGDMETARHIIETLDVGGTFFTPIAQVSPKLDGTIEIYPYSFEQTVELKKQPIAIETHPAHSEEERKLMARDRKAPDRFKRIQSILPTKVMSRKKVICVGCGGSRAFLETLARCGVGNFVLIDGDMVEDTNIATQGTFIPEIGRHKCDVIRECILNINPLAKVKCINKPLDNDMTDEQFLAVIGQNTAKDTLLCGCTDNFYAQDRCAQLSIKLGIPYLAAQIFKGGAGHEVLFSYPELTSNCPRCMLKSRYDKVIGRPIGMRDDENSSDATGSSAGTAVFVTDHLNSIKTYVALMILCYKDENTAYFGLLDKYKDRNYFMTRLNDSIKAPAFEPIDDVSVHEVDLSFPFVTIAIGQTPEPMCPMCGGGGDAYAYKGKISDTRHITMTDRQLRMSEMGSGWYKYHIAAEDN